MRRLSRTLRPTLRALLAHRLRVVLALSSVAIGVAAVVLTSAIGKGAEREVLRSIEAMGGANLLVVRPAQAKRLVARKAVRGAVTSLDLADCAAILEVSLVREAVPGTDRALRVKAGRAALVTKVLGTSPGFQSVRRFRLHRYQEEKEGLGANLERPCFRRGGPWDAVRHPMWPPWVGGRRGTRQLLQGGHAGCLRHPADRPYENPGTTVRLAPTGRFFDAADDQAARRVAVLGAHVAEVLFPGENPVGRTIRVRGVPFAVIGTLEAKGILADGSDEDDQILIPVRTALRRVFNTTWLNTVFVSVRDPRRMDEAQAAIGEILQARHAKADFDIQNQAKLLATRREMTKNLTLLTTGLSAVALLVGGTGILALMLLSVRERTGEIGLRMAVGARPRDVLVQFLAEATALALGGWLLGLAASGLGAAAVAFGTDWKIGLPLEALLASLAMAAATGLGFGAVPARKAARLPPIQALRTE